MTEIEDKYAAISGAASFLGNSLSAETPTPGNTGRFRHYQGGSIYWSAATGAHSIHGPIRDHWAQLQWERGFLRFPLIDVTPTPNGLVHYTHFQGGSIYLTPSHGAHGLHGPVLNKWASMDWERSVLGFPVIGVRPVRTASASSRTSSGVRSTRHRRSAPKRCMGSSGLGGQP